MTKTEKPSNTGNGFGLAVIREEGKIIPEGDPSHPRSGVTREDMIHLSKQIDVAAATLNTKITELDNRIEALDKHSTRWRNMIWDLKMHLSKKDRIAFDKRYYT